MATIKVIDLGTVPNDGTGDPLRTGGRDINDNFTELNIKKLEVGGYGGTAQDLANAISAIQANYLTTNTAQTVTAVKTFNVLPQSVAVPTAAADLTTKNYVDTQIGNISSSTLQQVIDAGNSAGSPDGNSGVLFDLLDNGNGEINLIVSELTNFNDPANFGTQLNLTKAGGGLIGISNAYEGFIGFVDLNSNGISPFMQRVNVNTGGATRLIIDDSRYNADSNLFMLKCQG